MTALSPYLGVTFPRHEAAYERFLTFHDASPQEVAEWKAAFLWFLQEADAQVRTRAGAEVADAHRPRAAAAGAFPDARFVHVHRHPYEVFQSFQHYYDTAMWHTYLQRPTSTPSTRASCAATPRCTTRSLPTCRSFRPAASTSCASTIWSAIRWADADDSTRGWVSTASIALEPRLTAYLATVRDYERNSFAPLAPEPGARVSRASGGAASTLGLPCLIGTRPARATRGSATCAAFRRDVLGLLRRRRPRPWRRRPLSVGPLVAHLVNHPDHVARVLQSRPAATTSRRAARRPSRRSAPKAC